MKVLVTGVSGQLGHDAAKELTRRGAAFLGVGSKELNVADRDAVLRVMEEYRPDAVLHCAAWTKVDQAEDEPEACMRVNVDGTRHIAEACRKLGAKLVYVSTDYVFPGTGDRPWEIGDETGPLNVYGRSKLAGEAAVRELLENYFIVRTSWVIGAHGNNFVKTMLRLAETHRELRVVGDQIGSPTFYGGLGPAAVRYDRDREVRCLSRDERELLLLGGAGRGGLPHRREGRRRAPRQHGEIRREGAAPEKLPPEQALPGRGRLCETAGVGGFACAVFEGAGIELP